MLEKTLTEDQSNSRRTKATEMTSLQLPAGSKHAWTSASRGVKRLMDLVGGLGAFILLSPLFLLFAALLRLESKKPIFVRESRIGLGGAEIMVRRYRIRQGGLNDAVDGDMFEPMVSRTGDYLERTGLEYLPYLISVIRGDLSLIGPRAMTLAEARIVAREDPTAYAIRNSVPPGLFGPWQLLGRLGTDLPMMVEIDIHYINQWSLILDVILLIQTCTTNMFFR